VTAEGKFNTEVDGAGRDEWSRALGGFDDATPYHTWDYAAAIFPGQTASHLVAYRGGEAVGMALARIAALPVAGRGIAHIAWGPLWRRKGEARDKAALDAVLEAVKKEYAGRRKLVVRVATSILAEEEDAVAAFARAGFVRTDARAYRTMILDIARPLEEIRKGFAQKWRNCLNRGERNGLEVTEGTSREQYAGFLAIYDELMERKAFDTGVDAHRWAGLQEALPEGEKLRVLLAHKEGKAVAGMAFSRTGERGIYLLGATSEEGLKLQGSYVLQRRAIEMMKEAGCRLYDLGGIDPEANPGVYHFKEGLGGRDVSHAGVFEYSESAASRVIVAVGEKLWGALAKARGGRRRVGK
jgi:hypothetical protein